MFDLSITRTPAVLKMDNKSKNCIGSGLRPFPVNVHVFQTPLLTADIPAIWVGKITTSDPYSQAVVKTFTLPVISPQSANPSKRAFKERSFEKGRKDKKAFETSKTFSAFPPPFRGCSGTLPGSGAQR
jgi:hypothetical protein